MKVCAQVKVCDIFFFSCLFHLQTSSEERKKAERLGSFLIWHNLMIIIHS